MLLVVAAVFDSKSSTFIYPQNFRRKEEAMRSFSLACNEPTSDFHKYAEDYALYSIATYDDETGVYTSHQPICLIQAIKASTLHNNYYFLNSKSLSDSKSPSNDSELTKAV